MADVVGRATVKVTSDLDPQSFDRDGKRAGGILSKGLVGLAGAAGTAVGAVIGTSLVKGFQRLSAIEEAQAKLKGLGNSAKTVEQVMDDALASVKGTAFGLGDAASVAASAIASGVKPGKQLERTLKLVADASTIAGTDLGEMGAIFNKVAATNKVQGEVLNQLGERGIPIIQLLSKTMGISAEQVVDFASKGKIGFKEFQTAIEEGMGGAALESGNTFKGALANAGAALGRFGAALLGPSFANGAGVIKNITKLIDRITPAAEVAGKAIRDFFSSPGVTEFGEKVRVMWEDHVKPALSKMKKAWDEQEPTIRKIVRALDRIWEVIDGPLFKALGKLADFMGGSFKTNMEAAAVPLGIIADALDAIADAAETADGAIKKFTETGNSKGLVDALVNFGKFLAFGPGVDPDAMAGGGVSRGGLTLVGERGPELVNMPRGANVHTAGETRKMLRQSGVNNVHVAVNLFGPQTSIGIVRQADWAYKFATQTGG